MPCVRCSTRETDPVRGPSGWKRAVQHGRQVLVCPDCQQDHNWTAELDRCAACDSTMLARALGETRCRACGEVQQAGLVPAEPAMAAAGLAEDVSAALERLLRRREPS
ncbi:MAG: hypothetical protein NVSMB13_02210 [Mycobacteriales bacterium]